MRVARALVRAGLGLSGVRAVATLELSEAGVEATLAWRALGREHRRRRLTRPWSSVVAMRVRPARGALGYVVRGLPLLALVLGGLLLAGEGLRAGAALAVLVGAALVALGVAVDLLLDHRAARRRPAAELRLDAGPGLRLRLRVQDGARAEEVGREVARRRAAGPSAAADPPATARQGRAAG